ncbi:unnamed protein product, partial [Ectocarpus fasciculatus]
MTGLWIILGLVGIVVGSDVALRGAEAITRRLGIPPLIVGLTLTSVGTSLPEIATNIAAGLSSAAGEDASGLLVGNIVGSCFSQITLLLGITGLAATLARPTGFRRDGAMMLLAVGLMYAACADGTVSPLEGGALIAAYLAYVAALIVITLRQQRSDTPAPEAASGSVVWDLARAGVGLALVLYSADVVVGESTALARQVRISDGL